MCLAPVQEPTQINGKAKLRALLMFFDIIFMFFTSSHYTSLNKCPRRQHTPQSSFTVLVEVSLGLRVCLNWLSTSDNNSNNVLSVNLGCSSWYTFKLYLTVLRLLFFLRAARILFRECTYVNFFKEAYQLQITILFSWIIQANWLKNIVGITGVLIGKIFKNNWF